MAAEESCWALLCFALFCGQFRCSNTQDHQACNCPGGCGNNGTTLPGSDGRIVNVAYGKSANVSSGSGPACTAVNGRTGTVWKPNNTIDVNCVFTDDGDFNASWEVDLGDTYTVSDISIYRRTNNQRRMAEVSVYVDDQLCYSFPNSTNVTALDALPEQIDITCNPPLTGQVVSFQKHGRDRESQFSNIVLCEVQVWACKPGLYGDQCDQTCSGHCKDNDTCDNYYGTCPRDCEPGWTPPFCNQSAGADEDIFVIAGAAVGGLVVIAFATILIVCYVQRNRNRSSLQPSTDDTVRPQDHVYQNSEFINSVEPIPQTLAPEHSPALFPFEEEQNSSSQTLAPEHLPALFPFEEEQNSSSQTLAPEHPPALFPFEEEQ